MSPVGMLSPEPSSTHSGLYTCSPYFHRLIRVDISSLPLKSVKSENAALVGSAMHSVAFALYRVDTERKSGFYKKFKDLIDVSQYGIVTVIEAKAVETDCAVIDDDGIVDVEEDCKDTGVSYKCKFVYFYSYGYDASVDCVSVN
ncbi:hypothetical protein T06_1938 [Trichinella sp. T6]|nr:hypothetical protein T06_1938 [Trichinella sp. T6]